jgi:bacterioferritin
MISPLGPDARAFAACACSASATRRGRMTARYVRWRTDRRNAPGRDWLDSQLFVGGNMKGDKKVIQHLNTVLANELTAINQYFLHSKMFKNWGLDKLAAHEQDESLDEMKHADRLLDRILFLEGRPVIQMNKLLIGESAKEVLSCDLKLERSGHTDLKQAIAYCEEIGDYVSRDLVQYIIESEEKHIDWLETQLALIDKVSLQNYLQANMACHVNA